MRNLIIAREAGGQAIWVGDGVTRRHVEDTAELEGLRYWIGQRGGDPSVHDFADLRVLGKDVEGPAPVELDYNRFVNDVVDRLADRLSAPKPDPEPEQAQP